MNENPPGLAEFNEQVTSLFEEHGTDSFYALSGQLPKFTLFVEDDKVIAEPDTSPRHRYGVYYTSDVELSGDQISEHLNRWLKSGETYQEFLATNVFRYNP